MAYLRMLGLLSLALICVAAGSGKPKNHWTVIYYAGGCNSCEETIMDDIAEMKRGFVDGQGLEFVMLIDRVAGFSADASVFGEDFTDTRLYRISKDKTERLEGGPELPEITRTSQFDANMGDAQTLKKFIRFCKAHYPADHYALIIYSHGAGPWVCYDDESDQDAIYTAEFTDILSSREAVDFFGLDVCSMGGAENMYQWRPGNGSFNARIVIASAPSTGPWAYDRIFSRLKAGAGESNELDATLGGKERDVDPAAMTALDLAGVIFEEIHDGQPEECWSCYDLTKAGALKKAVDVLAQSLANGAKKEDLDEARGFNRPKTTFYLQAELNGMMSREPYFDIYGLAKNLSSSEKLSEAVRTSARAVSQAVDDVVVFSYAQPDDYPGFEDGKHGLYIFCPLGDWTIQGKRHWARQQWYSPLDMTKEAELKSQRLRPYGKYLWCQDGAKAGNDRVENWFELLDSWYDTGNGKDGGLNKYRW
jgi:clostripain